MENLLPRSGRQPGAPNERRSAETSRLDGQGRVSARGTHLVGPRRVGANKPQAQRCSAETKPQAERKPTPLEAAVRLLGRSDRSVEQVRLHLSRRGYSRREIQNTLTTLHRFGYLDDGAVALRLAQSYLHRRPVGRNGLREVLRRRGFDTETADDAVRQAYELTTEEAVAARFLSTLPVKFKDPMRESHRRARLLFTRSFSQDVIEPLLGSASPGQNL